MRGPWPCAAVYFDGESAARHSVTVELAIDGLTLLIRRNDGKGVRWPIDQVRALSGERAAERGRLTLALRAETDIESPRDPARLVIEDAAAVAWFHRTRPDLFRRDIRAGTWRRLALWSAGAAAAIGLMLFVVLPGLADFLARTMSPEAEAAFGAEVMAQIVWLVDGSSVEDLTCDRPEGLAALAALRARLLGSRDIGYDLDLRVFDSDKVNAFAAPGGQIVIFRGLIDQAESPDEVAGVLAHEIGHVAARDPMRLTLRSVGSAGLLSLLFGDVSGGAAMALVGEHVLQSSYSRRAEDAADKFALALMADAAIDPAPTASFFERLAESTDSVPEFLSSHPLSAGRAVAMRQAANATLTRPVLNDTEWAALRTICADEG